MLQLKKIKKSYKTGDFVQHALKGIDVEFRENEFVAILGPSGSGKTTMLNIIGGLDRYDYGDLIINGKSTKEFKDKDWDAYRNNCIGFIFQSYNLIGHISVLQNVEMSMTLSGVSAKKRRRKALEVLNKVGLKEHAHKRPNQLSGGQMQRVAIARALVNDPEIIMADEPTGALDSQTSIQILELIKEIAEDKLVIMVTHNPELAENYASRIIKFKDGNLIDDSNPITKKDKINKELNLKHTQMSYKTALSLSFTNLMTKKGRTVLTSLAGSIGIIGIALILSLSHGMQSYIDRVQEETLSSYPLTIAEASVDMTDMMASMKPSEGTENQKENKIYSNNIMNKMMNMVTAKVTTNNLKEFKSQIEKDKKLKEYTNAISYSYDLNLNIYRNVNGENIKVNPTQVMDNLGMGLNQMQQQMMKTDVFQELFNNDELNKQMYDVVKGRWPENYDEVVLLIDKNNQVSDFTLYSLGILDQDELELIMKKIMAGEVIEESKKHEFDYEDFLNLEFKVLQNSDYYDKVNNLWINKEHDKKYINEKLNNALKLKVVGIIRPNEEAVSQASSGMIYYSKDLTEYIINKNNESQIVKEQKENPEINVLTKMSFNDNNKFDPSNMSPEQLAYIQSLPPTELAQLMQNYQEQAGSTYEQVLKQIGGIDINSPSMINIYPKDFDSKEEVINYIADYNKTQEKNGKEENVIDYQDLVGMLMSSVSTIINVISYALMAFVSISLVVSSIMIGIITYISVLERTKEIGILRAIGASKKDITRIFNAETVIEGFIAGTLGILITLLLNIPINIIVKNITDISNLSKLPFMGAIILIILSTILTIVGGFIPAIYASKKDPVEALRTE
ncbi:MAG: ABC transporter ATP-binding protein/permease [Bacilli bacterium]|nr:ABC transporter ATP-binding protein/permease [Bacilli bacterium]